MKRGKAWLVGCVGVVGLVDDAGISPNMYDFLQANCGQGVADRDVEQTARMAASACCLAIAWRMISGTAL